MPRLEGMYAPGNQDCHIMTPAGYKDPVPSDVFRYNRVCPFYPPHPCIRPNERDLTCPEEKLPCPVNHPWMPTAGIDLHIPSDTFRYQKVYPPVDGNPCRPDEESYPDVSSGPVMRDKPCPCINSPRYPPSKPGRHFDFRYPSGPTDCTSAAHKHGHIPANCSGPPTPAPPCSWKAKPTSADCVQRTASNGGFRIDSSKVQKIFSSGLNHSQRIHPAEFNHQLAGDSHVQMAQDQLAWPTTLDLMIEGQPGAAVSTMAGNIHASEPDYVSRGYGSVGSMASHPARSRQSYNLFCDCNRGQGGCPDSYAVTGDLTYTNPGHSTCTWCSVNQTRADANRIITHLSGPCPLCHRPYHPAPYVCRPVYNKKCLMGYPEQNGPPADSYTFL